MDFFFKRFFFQFHRIRYFKAIETGQILWDREKRIDLITKNYTNPASDVINDDDDDDDKDDKEEDDDSIIVSVSIDTDTYNNKNLSSSTSEVINEFPSCNNNNNNNNITTTTKTTQQIISTKSKKNYLKKQRQKSLKLLCEQARLELEEEERIKREHCLQHEEKIREVEERIKKFQDMQVKV